MNMFHEVCLPAFMNAGKQEIVISFEIIYQRKVGVPLQGGIIGII